MLIFLGTIITLIVVGGIYIMYSQSLSLRSIILTAFQTHADTVTKLTEEIRLERLAHSEIVVKMDQDFKALVESYLRESGKVYVRPPFEAPPPPPSTSTVTKSGGPRAFQFKSLAQIESEQGDNKPLNYDKVSKN